MLQEVCEHGKLWGDSATSAQEGKSLLGLGFDAYLELMPNLLLSACLLLLPGLLCR